MKEPTASLAAIIVGTLIAWVGLSLWIIVDTTWAISTAGILGYTGGFIVGFADHIGEMVSNE